MKPIVCTLCGEGGYTLIIREDGNYQHGGNELSLSWCRAQQEASKQIKQLSGGKKRGD